MRVFELQRQFAQLWKLSRAQLDDPSQKAYVRHQAMILWDHNRDAALTRKVFGASRASLYRWRKRWIPSDPSSLEDRSSRPRRVRRPAWSDELVEAVLTLRQQYPRWGKDKLVRLVHDAGHTTSTSTVGRILNQLKQTGRLTEAPRGRVLARRRRVQRPYAVRKPPDYQVERPGDLVQLDTLDVHIMPGVHHKHFTARDVVSRWDVLDIYTRATAATAASFLDHLQAQAPFAITAIQVDGGSEFHGAFEQQCRDRQIKLFVLPPRSPKLNGSVESAQRTHTEEFYQVYDLPWRVRDIRPHLKHWQDTYNYIRPHQSLGQLTPAQFLANAGILPRPPPLSHTS
jgi:transposase InsO family protein